MPGFARNSLNFQEINRLLSKKDFKSVFAKPHKVSLKFFIALYHPNQRSYPRLGIILAKQHLKRAVDRNLVRRLLKESFRVHKEMLKGLDIIVLLRSECTPLDKKALRVDVDNLWQKLAASYKPA